MNRRSLLAALTFLPTANALAEHGWEPYDLARPLFLEGPVMTIIWGDPHPYLELLHRPRENAVPAEILNREVPRQQENIDARGLLRKALVPTVHGEIWRVELPSLARMSKWKMPRPKIEQVVSLLGYLGPQLLDTKTVRAEIFFVDGKAYPMRSDPA